MTVRFLKDFAVTARQTGIYGESGIGKSRFGAACCRALPHVFGEKAIYVCVDPEAEVMASLLPEDRARMIPVGVNLSESIFDQLSEIYTYDFSKEVGSPLYTVITDTLSVAAQTMLYQLANSSLFAKNPITLSANPKYKVINPDEGTYGGTQALVAQLLKLQKASGVNHITIYHEAEDKPDPGKAGKHVGGPKTAGRAQIGFISAWHSTLLRVGMDVQRGPIGTKPNYVRTVFTDVEDFWNGKVRTNLAENPIKKIVLPTDPVTVWQTIESVLQGTYTPENKNV